jgi:hypothetical protein
MAFATEPELSTCEQLLLPTNTLSLSLSAKYFQPLQLIGYSKNSRVISLLPRG